MILVLAIFLKNGKHKVFFFFNGLLEVSSVTRVCLYHSNTLRYWTHNGGNFSNGLASSRNRLMDITQWKGTWGT